MPKCRETDWLPPGIAILQLSIVCVCVWERERAVSGARGLHCQSWPGMTFHTSVRPCCLCWARRCPLTQTHPPHPPAAEQWEDTAVTQKQQSAEQRRGGETGTAPRWGCSPVLEACPLGEYQTLYHRSKSQSRIRQRETDGWKRKSQSRGFYLCFLVYDWWKLLQKQHFIFQWKSKLRVADVRGEIWEKRLSCLAGQ